MRTVLFLLILIIGLSANAQTREKLQGTWVVRNPDTTTKQTKEIEFQFKKKDDWIIIRSKGRLNAGAFRSTANISETRSSLSYVTSIDGKFYTMSYRYEFLSDDVLILKNANDAVDIMTLDRKK